MQLREQLLKTGEVQRKLMTLQAQLAGEHQVKVFARAKIRFDGTLQKRCKKFTKSEKIGWSEALSFSFSNGIARKSAKRQGQEYKYPRCVSYTTLWCIVRHGFNFLGQAHEFQRTVLLVRPPAAVVPYHEHTVTILNVADTLPCYT